MKTLSLAKTLALPLDYVTSRNMVLAQSGAGKSNVCVVLAEEMHRNGIPWIAIDTKGDWYGVRSSRDGKGRGLDVPVFGGEFGDMPLSPLAGTRMAELAAAGKFSGVLDVSDFAKTSDVSRFLTDFANTLLKKQRTPLHLFLEECHDYLPQGGYRGQVDPLAAACVGAMKRLATKGRFRGIGYTLISQRAAEVNKTVLYQCETLIALRMVGDLDIKWIEGWVKRGSKRAAEILETLPDLRDGECWVWSPQRLKLTTRVQARRRETFDSGAAPEIGKARVAPKMAPVELEALRKELADLEAQAKADDPKELKKKIVELEKVAALANRKLSPSMIREAATTPKGITLGDFEVIVDRRHVEALIESSECLEEGLDEFAKALETVRRRANGTAAAGRRARATGPAALAKRLAKSPAPKKGTISEKFLREGKRDLNYLGAPKSPSAPRDSGARLPAGERAILIAIAQHPNGVTREQIGIITGYKRSTRDAYLQRLGAAGLFVQFGHGEIQATTEGRDALGSDYEPLPTGGALLEHWLANLPEGERKVLEAVAVERTITRDAIGELTGYKRSTRDAYIQRLAARRLVDAGRGEVTLSKELT